MTNISNLTTGQLKSIVAIKEQIEVLQDRINSIAGGGEVPSPFALKLPKKRRMSRAGRARIAAAQRARWAKVKAPKKKDRRSSPAVRAKLAAAARARWAKAKAEGKRTL